RGYLTTQFYTAIIDHSTPDDNMLIGGLQDNGNFFVNSDDPTAPWRQTVNGDGSFGAVAPGKAYYILSIQQGRVAKCSLDAAGNVLAFRRIDPIGPLKDDYEFINPLALDPNDANVLYLPAGRKVYRQNELGAISLTGEWDSISQGWVQYPDTLTPAQGTFTAIAVSQSNPAHRMYLGTSNNKLFKVDNAHTGQPSFTSITPPLAGTAGYINCIAIDPDNADDIVIVYSNYKVYSLFRSLNGGQNWIKVGGNLEGSVGGTGAGPSLRWLSILPYPNGAKKYFCGTSVGLFSADTLKLHAAGQAGTLWTLEGPNEIGSTVVDFVDVRPSDGLVVAATHGNGMFSANFLQNSAQHQPVQQHSVSVSPNPANAYAVFDVQGNAGKKFDIRLYDLQGRLVRQIQTDNSRQRVETGDLPNGVYVYGIQGVGWSKSGKLIVGH
ncbi:MAG TPA: T9SS type A sorting domain-containing protein, partial [Saprospiraceae bacterium]|nr:T9SS type A sorting domain-containing protein [Saprospiraceae bacterium]